MTDLVWISSLSLLNPQGSHISRGWGKKNNCESSRSG